MYTLCGHCRTIHEVSPEALASGRGRLRCENCGEDFDALEYLSREPPAAKPDAPPQSATAQRQEALNFDGVAPYSAAPEADPALSSTRLTDQPDSEDTVDVVEAQSDDTQIDAKTAQSDFTDVALNVNAKPEAASEYGGDDIANSRSPLTEPTHEHDQANDPDAAAGLLDEEGDDQDEALDDDSNERLDVEAAAAPSFIPAPPRATRISAETRHWPRWLLVAGLALLLMAQSIVSERDQLAADAAWRPWLVRACAHLGCSLPIWHDPSAMHILTRDVRPHPSVSDALMISTSFRNEAQWPQHWPNLLLTLADLDGQTIASREFKPSDYLGLGASERTIEAGQTASITLEVRDPGKQAVAFEFDFR